MTLLHKGFELQVELFFNAENDVAEEDHLVTLAVISEQLLNSIKVVPFSHLIAIFLLLGLLGLFLLFQLLLSFTLLFLLLLFFLQLLLLLLLLPVFVGKCRCPASLSWLFPNWRPLTRLVNNLLKRLRIFLLLIIR